MGGCRAMLKRLLSHLHIQVTVAVIATVPIACVAQSPRLTLIGPYIEKFEGNPTVAGDLIVGLFGNPSGDQRFEPLSIYVQTPPETKGQKACVSIATQDAVYHSQNLYYIPVG